MNLLSSDFPALVGLWEDGGASSALANSAMSGGYSSGALIQVLEGETPYTLSLRNFGNPIIIEDRPPTDNVAVSIRILRFADNAE